jgi:hypothetical protein
LPEPELLIREAFDVLMTDRQYIVVQPTVIPTMEALE